MSTSTSSPVAQFSSPFCNLRKQTVFYSCSWVSMPSCLFSSLLLAVAGISFSSSLVYLVIRCSCSRECINKLNWSHVPLAQVPGVVSVLSSCCRECTKGTLKLVEGRIHLLELPSLPQYFQG